MLHIDSDGSGVTVSTLHKINAKDLAAIILLWFVSGLFIGYGTMAYMSMNAKLESRYHTILSTNRIPSTAGGLALIVLAAAILLLIH